jgi:hypothetical protein
LLRQNPVNFNAKRRSAYSDLNNRFIPKTVKTTLFVNYYLHAQEARQREIDECLWRNCALQQFDRVVILASIEHCQDWWLLNPKITWEPIDLAAHPHGRPTFKAFFECVNRYNTSPEDLNVVANADIVFDATLDLLKDRDLQGICVALGRWETNGEEDELLVWDNSQDVWIFQGRVRPLGWVDFPMGAWGCDNRLAWQLRHDDYILINPAKDIICRHVHGSAVRNTLSHVGGPSDIVCRCELRECGLRAKRANPFGIISFSLWGDDSKYCQGAVHNAILARHLYPGWTLRFYHDSSVPADILMQLFELKCELFPMPEHEGFSGLFWRFLAADDPSFERWLVRDTDARLNYRERRAVDEWMESGLDFHVMRDHPYHGNAILGCGFGGLRGVVSNIADKIARWPSKLAYGDDEKFLAEEVWPNVRSTALIHDAFATGPGGDGKPFPTRREFWRFVGEICHHDEHWVHAHRNALFLKEAQYGTT